MALEAKQNVRVLACGAWDEKRAAGLALKQVTGGLLVQDADTQGAAAPELSCVTAREPTAEELSDLMLAWKVVKYVKSNAIVCCRASARPESPHKEVR